MDYSNLFGWWISSITFNIGFVIAASIYLYRRGKGVSRSPVGRVKRWLKDFAFVWILLGLLVLYVVSVGEGSFLLFAAGNIVVQIILVIYVVKSGNSADKVV